ILHLNGYKIANPTIFARIPRTELEAFLVGCGHRPYWFEGGFDGAATDAVHRRFGELLDEVLDEIDRIRREAAAGALTTRPAWPMIVLQTPKGWTGPREIDGQPIENTYRSHQVPMKDVRGNSEYTELLEEWMRSYRPEELFDDAGRVRDHIRALNPRGGRRMSANPHTNGGQLTRDLVLPDFRTYAVRVDTPGATVAEATRVLGDWLA